MPNLPVSVGDTHHAIVGQDDLQYSVGRILKTYIAEQHAVNSLGARLINGMIHYYFIQGSRFSLEGAKKMAFQKMDF